MNEVESYMYRDYCDPNKETIYGKGLNFTKFIVYVKTLLKPYMAMDFIEEKYYEAVWDDLWNNHFVVLQLPRGHSKAQPLTSKILTPHGWTQMGSLKIGDQVIGIDGKKTTVRGIYPQGTKRNFLVTTRDGRKMQCCDEHICVVQCPSNTGSRILYKKLKEIMLNYKFERYDKRNGKHYTEFRYFIPTIQPIVYSKKDQPIDAYTMGIWLGDGHNKGGVISTADREILGYLPYTITKYSTKYEYGVLGIQKHLRLMNLLRNKHIPNIYLMGSVHQREELLQGLMDGDGHVQMDGKRTGFTTIYKQLRDDYVSLVRSLGGTATVSIQWTRFNKENPYKKSFSITARFPDSIKPFKLKRKAERWKGSIKTKSAIVSIKELEPTDMQCISVDRQTYVTNDYLPTHNTEMVGIWLTIYLADYQPYNPFYEKFKGAKKRIVEQMLLAGAQTDLNVWVERIKDFFYKAPHLFKLKPTGVDKDKTNSRWNDKEMNLTNGSIIHGRTVKGKIRGLHNDRVCADDLITESASLTDRQTIDIWDGAVDGTTTTKEAMVQVIGTPLRATDIQYHLKDKPDGYYFKARPAIIDEERKLVLSPNRRNYDDLMRTKARIGSTKFSTEYMLNPIDDTVSLVKRAHLMSCCDTYLEGLWLKPIITKTANTVEIKFDKKNNVNYRREDWEQVFITADFAFSDRVTADFSVFSYYGIKNGKAHRLGYIRSQGWSPITQMAILSELKNYLGATLLGLEENSIKGILKDVRHLNLPVKLFWMGAKDKAPTYKPEVSFSDKRYIIGKIMAVERLDGSYENGRFVIPYKTKLDKDRADLQIEESISWALDEGKLVEIGRHPDIPITDILMNEIMQTGSVKAEMAVVKRVDVGEYPDIDDGIKRIPVKTQGIEGEKT